jgi:polar amino acid transport system substrate-binding protein
MTRLLISTAIALSLGASVALAGGHCAAGKTLTEGKLTIATGNPAYYPWVLNDDPESGEGFEAAVAYAVAAEMGFAAEDVVWVRSSFDEAIQPGAKNFDVNMQQYSITPERDEVVDFSAPYYAAPMAVLLAPGVEAEASMDALKALKWGAASATTAVTMLEEVIAPSQDLLMYGDTADVGAAMTAGQIDAALFDLPTALFMSAVMIEGASVLGQFPAERSEKPDQFGMLMEDGNALKECVDAALAALSESGALAEIEATWLQEATGVPLIQ